MVTLVVALHRGPAAADVDATKPTAADAERLQTGIDPDQTEATNAAELTTSTDVVTPISPFAEKDLHPQALDLLIKANNLLAQKQYEAASDAALQAYDNLKDLRLRRRKRRERAKLLAERHQAATTYIQASIPFVEDFARRSSGTAEALDEARSRLEDLRDVAREYPELARQLDQSIAQLPAPKAP